jgi:VWFA-related protein
VRPGDTLIIRNDYGSVRILAWGQSRLEARIEKNSGSAVSPDKIQVAAEKKGDKIFFYSFFQDTAPGSVALDIQVPSFINVVIWGANPEIEVSGISGYVRVQTINGPVAAQDLTSSVSLITEEADIWLRSRLQPQGDQRLESSFGSILCEVRESLSFHGWTRAGGKLTWSPGFELEGGRHEQQVGSGGPLLYASSLHGNVRLHFLPAASSPQASAQAEPAVKGTQQQPAPSAGPRTADNRPGPPPKAESAPSKEPGSAEKPKEPVDVQPASSTAAVSIKVNVDWVYLNVSVRDRYSNRSIPDLQRNDFLVYEDNILQDVQQFTSTEAPFNLLLLLDISGSTKGYLNLVKEASIDFTREIKSSDRIAVATFNSRSQLIQEFTNNRAEVAASISRIRSGGGTAFYDALASCVDAYLAGVEGRTAIVVFTDGVDNQLTGESTGSRIRFEELFSKIQEIDPIIYTIFLDTEGRVPITQVPTRGPAPGGTGSLGGIIGIILGGGGVPTYPGGRVPTGRIPAGRSEHEAYRIARDQLQEIADQTGGRLYSPQRIEDLSGAYSEIADDLRIQYLLGYNSANRTSQRTWHSIAVKIKDRPDAVARTRKGYYTRSERTKSGGPQP